MPSFDRTRFKTTHNSYSGDGRGSLPNQLGTLGVRCVEFDFHDNGYDEFKDYRVGHLKPGMEVARGNGNPDSLMLKDWLGAVAAWSATNAGHAPITIVLDAKDDLTDNDDGGDLEDLNLTLEAVFGARLFTRDDYDAARGWPDVARLQDRILCVLSGDGGTRVSYRWAHGSPPAMSINANGDAVLVYRSSAGDLNCWSGRADAAARAVRWRRKSTYGQSPFGLSEPAVAINDDGWVIGVHRFGPPPGFPDPLLESRVGRLQDDGRILWFSGHILAQGIAPSLRLDGDSVREIHTMPDGVRRQSVRGTLDRQARRVDWQKPRATQDSPFQRETAPWEGHLLRAGLDGDVIACGFDGDAPRPVRFRQLAFVELQAGEKPASMKDALFFGAGASDTAALADARHRGLVARAWAFGEEDQTAAPCPPQENMPATDTPADRWYVDYLA